MNKLNNCERIERDALEGKVILASQAGLDALAKRIKLVEAERDNVKNRLGESVREDPDLPENIEFKELKTRLQFEIPKLLADLRAESLKSVLHFEDQDGLVRFGTRFEAVVHYSVEDIESGLFQLLGPLEAKYLERGLYQPVSYLTPFGRAVWGMQGTVKYQSPGGEVECVISRIVK